MARFNTSLGGQNPFAWSPLNGYVGPQRHQLQLPPPTIPILCQQIPPKSYEQWVTSTNQKLLGLAVRDRLAWSMHRYVSFCLPMNIIMLPLPNLATESQQANDTTPSKMARQDTLSPRDQAHQPSLYLLQSPNHAGNEAASQAKHKQSCRRHRWHCRHNDRHSKYSVTRCIFWDTWYRRQAHYLDIWTWGPKYSYHTESTSTRRKMERMRSSFESLLQCLGSRYSTFRQVELHAQLFVHP